MGEYEDFLDRRAQSGAAHGFDPVFMPDCLFDFQKAIVGWAVRKGRAAIFADCGLGKTPMQLAWAENVARHTRKPVLILTPLAVAPQTVHEGEKFGIECVRSSDGHIPGRIVVTNYQRLSRFDPTAFGGVVCDESSILKAFDGSTRGEVTRFMRKIPYRLLATATAAPNDYIELGTSSEALGYMGYMDMLGKFFVNDNNNSASRRFYGEVTKWRFRGHAEVPFWRWVASWARACRRPSDLGFDDSRFELPALREVEHLVEPQSAPPGMLFALPATDLASQRSEKRRTIEERCEMVAELVNGTGEPALVWCHLNDEADMLERMISGAQQVKGSDSDDSKESRLCGFADGAFRVLVTKPKIGAWGLNYQHCSHVTFFPSHSYEQYYQAVRRCWRFGQDRDVRVDIVLTEGERAVMRNLMRKSKAADEMFSRLVAEMSAAQGLSIDWSFNHEEKVPAWL